MKKALIGMVAGAAALGASVVPASAGSDYLEGSAWDAIRTDECLLGDTSLLEQLILISDYANMLNSKGNSKPYYTVFAPIDDIVELVIDALDTTMAKLASAPAAVRAILDDHITNGSFAPDELKHTSLTRITMRSGYVISISGPAGIVNPADPGDLDPTVRRTNVYINGLIPVLTGFGLQVRNGWVYCIGGFIDSTGQVPTEGLNALDSPKDGTPGGTNSLPDTL